MDSVDPKFWLLVEVSEIFQDNQMKEEIYVNYNLILRSEDFAYCPI